jgi:quinol monooxygenase YgiN
VITEFAQIDIKPGANAAFEAAVAAAKPLFLAAEGCHGVELQRCVEQPDRYFLIAQWETLEHHTVKFRQTDAFTRWRELAGPHFAAPPQVLHGARVASV